MGRCAARCITTGNENVILGCAAMGGATNTGHYNVVLGKEAGKNATGAEGNVFLGAYAGKSINTGDFNVHLGYNSGNTTSSGCKNITIGCNVELPSASGNFQLAIGQGTDLWVEGDSSYNVTLAGIATVSSATGIVSATKFCGDGSALTGISGGGFEQDSQGNLVAGTGAGAVSYTHLTLPTICSV